MTYRNCVTCGVDLNHCADKDLENNQCGFCSPKKPLKEMEIDGKKYEVKSTIPLNILLTIITTFVSSLALWQTQVENLSILIMILFLINFFIWSKLLGYNMLKPITKEGERQ